MIRADEFEYLRRVLKERSGLALTEDKAYLVSTRLRPLVEQHRFPSLEAMVAHMRLRPHDDLVEQVVDAMTTNESLFFRDLRPFEALSELMLPALCAARGPSRPIRIWCAAASTGQEPYSIAIVLEENAARFGAQPVEILATDLSRAALRRAERGEYTQFEVGRGMPLEYLVRYFTRGERNHHTVVPKLRRRITFGCRNLLAPFGELAPMDIIFCRNVLIYFDRPTKTKVLERMAAIMPPDGYLVLGGPETTLGLTTALQRHPNWRNVYTRADACALSPRQRMSA